MAQVKVSNKHSISTQTEDFSEAWLKSENLRYLIQVIKLLTCVVTLLCIPKLD